MGDGGSTLTFLFTDVEGSTKLWEAAPTAMREDLARHDVLLAEVIERHAGSVFKYLGDGVAAVFERPADGVAAAVEAQRALGSEPWHVGALRVRMGLHSGDAQQRDGDWFGPTVIRASRLNAVAHGGQVVLSGTTAELVADELPPEIELVDLGEHRLRDLVEPVRIHQVAAPDLATQFAPLRTEHHPSRGVPAPSGHLLGRAEERQLLDTLIQDRRVVTITGPPGAGKTRLAIELARDQRDRWPGGIWFCSLGSLFPGASGADGVAGRLADLLGSAAAEGSSALDAVIGALSDRTALVVLDGCDQVIDDTAAVTRAIADACPGIALLVTTRERLDLPNEHLLELSTLDDDAAVALFVERAEAVRSQFELAPHEAAVHSLIRRLDGLPLAIELAAARVRTHSPAEIDQLLREHVQVLRTPKRRERAGASAGHHDLDAAISWSHDLLAPDEQRLFRHLAVFAASFTPEDVFELLGDVKVAECTDVLDALVDRSLVAIAPPDQRSRTSRYRMLSTIRSYARQRLTESGDESAAWTRRSHALADRVEAITPRLSGPDEARWVEEIALVWKDLRAVHQRASEAGDVALAARLVAALLHHSTMRGVEVGEWAERTLPLDGFWDLPQAPMVASLAAEVRMRQGNPDGARALAIDTIDRVGETETSAWLAHSTRCLMTYITGDYALGDRYQALLDALTESVTETEPLAPAIAAYVGATVMIYGGQDALVEPQLQRLARVAASSGSPSIRAMSQLLEGRFRLSSDPALARSVLQDSLDLATSVTNTQVIGQARWALAELSAADDPAGALAALRTLMTEFRTAGDDAQQQQSLLRSLGPLVSLEADEPALLVASALDGAVWGNTVLYQAGRSRLAERTSPEDFAVAERRAAGLGIMGVVDEVLEAIDGLNSST